MYAALSRRKESARSEYAMPLLFAAGVWLALHTLPVINGISPLAQGLLLDVDSYMKLVRIEHLLASGDWFDGRIPRSNAPFGETQHWTRLFDLIVILGAGLLRPFMSLGDIGGSAAGLGVWAGVELLLAAGFAAAALGLAWVPRGGRGWLHLNIAYAASFAAGAAAALVVERPASEYLAIESDRLSAMQLAAAAALVAVWCGIAAAARVRTWAQGAAGRAIGGGLAALPALAILLHVFPDFLSGPIGAVDPKTRAIWFDKVEEMRPLWPRTPQDAVMLLKLMGIGAAALPLLAWLLAVERRATEFPPRLGMAVVLLAVVPIALAHQRFAPYAEILFGMILAEGLRRVLARADAQRRPVKRVLLRVLPPVLVFLGPVFLGAKLASFAAPEAGEPDAAQRTCSITKIAGVLANAEWRARPQTILATIELGPELLYRTPHRVVGTPYQRNAAGIYDGYAALAEAEPASRAYFAKRKIDLVLLCPSIDKVFFDDPPRRGSLYNRLLRGDVPKWLAPVALPADLADTFKLFGALDRD
jgi:hypothetical protein